MRKGKTRRTGNPATGLFLLVAGLFLASTAPAEDERIPIKVVVAAMFENGEVTGDVPGELQLWVERLALDTALPFPLGERDLYLNDTGVMAVLLGGGISNATASVMALGADLRFDLSRAYWLIAGVAGGDPADLSLGSAAWAKHVIDGDLAYEIDGVLRDVRGADQDELATLHLENAHVSRDFLNRS